MRARWHCGGRKSERRGSLGMMVFRLLVSLSLSPFSKASKHAMSRVWKLTNLSWNKIPTALSTKREALSYDIQ